MLELKDKLAQQRKHIDELAKNMYVPTVDNRGYACVKFLILAVWDTLANNIFYSDEMVKNSGGEQN